ncbi:NAD(P)/FAD-dependent oxidoreductase [Pisciglobus halotolerans]|uniref:Pyridine nucleotide-disulphide oxidoreductase n=1 Tax=Pisciglobus halotolerans TaxID=745365 RepID=A0A1I3DCP2_9LACT|nr:FAD-dependent oxidoreductase [Pisciglobus halotolerans]SFH84477.1 Pyridine nucleotide-disulphide oxidoreductase [Pisciglobus halotolerans]
MAAQNETQQMQQANQSYDYLIIGGGVVAGYAATGIREQDQDGTIKILSNDQDVPYTRPALTKKLWTDSSFTEEQVPFHTTEETGAEIQLRSEVTAINRDRHTVQLADGSVIGYRKLLLATGSEPTKVKGPEDEHVIFFRSWEDYRKLRAQSGKHQHVLVVGGGYIGAELAAALVQNNTRATLIYPDNILGAKQFPEEIAHEYESAFKKAGVELVNGKRAESYRREDDELVLTLDDGTEIRGDSIVFGLGVSPRLSLAKDSGLEVTKGVVVDEYLRTSDPDIYAAGDIASYPDKILGRNLIGHVDHARKSGEAVGKAMAGSNEAYTHTPYFYSVVFDISWKAIGTLDPTLDTIVDKVNKGKVVYFLKDNKPAGILLWNAEADLDEVRQILQNPPADPAELKGAIQEK